MKMKFNILFTTLLAVSALAGCTEEIVKPELPVQKIVLSDLNKSMLIGETHQMSAEVQPENHAEDTIIWASENPEVATIDAQGLITALAEGKTMITANIDNVTAQCALKVTPVYVESVVLDKTELEMEPQGEFASYQLTATVLPDNASDKTVTWSVTAEPEGAVTVENGLVTAHEVGIAVVTAKAGDFEATCNVVVLGTEPVMMPPTLELLNGESGELKVTLPISLRGKTVTWTSMDETKATVVAKDGNDCIGIVNACGYGEVVIKATVEGKEMTSTITIPTKAIVNLDDYADTAAFEAAVVALDKKGVTEYVLSGSITKVGFVESGKGHNAFHEAPNVEIIDFSACKDWDKVNTKIVLDSTVPPMSKPGVTFTNGIGKAFNPDAGQYKKLRKLIFPEDLHVLGRYAIASLPALEEVVAPGVTHMHKDAFYQLLALKTVRLTASETFVYGSKVGERPFQGKPEYSEALKANCTLYLNPNKKSVVKGNTMFEMEFKAIVFE